MMEAVVGQKSSAGSDDFEESSPKVAVPIRLDPSVFARALTADLVDLLHPSDEFKTTTNYEDVLAAGEGCAEDKDRPWYEFRRPRFSTAHIDFAAGNFASQWIVVFLWTFFILYMAIITFFKLPGFEWLELANPETYNIAPCEEGEYGCYLWHNLFKWCLKFAIFVFVGYLFIGLGGLGNGLEKDGGICCNRRCAAVFGFVVVGLNLYLWARTVFLFLSPVEVEPDGNTLPTSSPVASGPSLDSQKDLDAVYSTTYIVEFFFTYSIMVLLLITVVTLQLWTITGLGGILNKLAHTTLHHEALMKKSAANKTNTLIRNALNVHSGGITVGDDNRGGESSLGSSILKFSMLEEESELMGGIFWCLKLYFNGGLLRVEGVQFPARVLALNLAQLMSAIILLFKLIKISIFVTDIWEQGNDDPVNKFLYPILEAAATSEGIDSTLSDLLEELNLIVGIIDATHGTDSASLIEAVSSVVATGANFYYPQERYMITIPFVILCVLSSLYAFSLFFVYVPSVCTTILKFRSGEIPFFGDKVMMRKYRSDIQTGTSLLGTMFWAGIIGPLLIGIAPAAIAFLFLYQATQPAMIKFTMSIVAVTITLGLKQILAVVFVKNEYHGFYRRNVNKVNLYSLAIESLQIGLGVLTAAVRAVVCLVTSILFISRIDTPLLANGVSVGPLGDNYPINFRKEVLALESHRHPWVQVLGKIYLTKLRYHSSFITSAGYAYRLIFILALMPWLRKHRLMARPELFGKGNDGSHQKSEEEAIQEIVRS